MDDVENINIVTAGGFTIPQDWLGQINSLPDQQLKTVKAEDLADSILKILLGYPIQLVPATFESNETRKSVSVACGMLEFERLLRANQIEAPNPHLVSAFCFDMSEFFEAVMSGKNHPLLDRWQELRKYRPKSLLRRNALEQICVLGARVFSQHGLSWKESNKTVANIANSTKVFEKAVTPKMVNNWKEKLDSLPESNLHELSKALKLGVLGEHPKLSRLYRFWAQWLKKALLATGMPATDQMLSEGIDPLEGYPEEIRNLIYSKNSF